MPKANVLNLETKDFSCEIEIPPDTGTYPCEIMLTHFGWHFTFALEREDLRRFISILNATLRRAAK